MPPAWTDVWICPDPRGHLQATGRDARGRKQYRYHPRWREVRDETKYGRLIDFARALPSIRRRTEADLRATGLPREKVLAAVVQLLEKTFIRVGNDRVRAHEQVVRPDDDARRARDGFPARRSGSSSAARAASITSWSSTTGGSRRSSSSAATCRARNSSSTSDRRRLVIDVVVRRRERVSEGVDGRGFHVEGLPDVGRHGPGGDAAARLRCRRLRAQPRRTSSGDRAGGEAAGQHAGRLPQVLRAPGGVRRVSRRRRW